MNLDPEIDLILTREIDAPRALIYACWTTPEHLMHWFVPKPNRVVACDLNVWPGGRCNTTFDVDGHLHENNGVYLEVIPNEKLVFTDTYTEGWKPNPEPFMTAIITFADAGPGRTLYTAVVRHRTKETAETHKKMGFYEGWGAAADQLAAYAQGLRT